MRAFVAVLVVALSATACGGDENASAEDCEPGVTDSETLNFYN
jgi:ABC-type glycerol-3-phosphate transport system substrate-binding protein